MKKLIIALTLAGCVGCKEVKVKCKVVSHATASDKYGSITYYTVANCEDGYVRSFTGVAEYALPEGSTIYNSYYVFNH